MALLAADIRQRVEEVAHEEGRTISYMCEVLIREALEHRDTRRRQAEQSQQ